jgi:hypothetical protein
MKLRETITARGRVTTDGIIELPENWSQTIDHGSITVQLTPISVYQELFVDHIEWGQKVIVRNSSGGPINAYYLVEATKNPS